MKSFCVLCEVHVSHLTTHLQEQHQSDIYEVDQRNNVSFLKLKGTNVDSELAFCCFCDGMVYIYRLLSHDCKHGLETVCALPPLCFPEGMGLDYCLMCQVRCGDIHEHKSEFHPENRHLVVQQLNGNTRALLPKGLNTNNLEPGLQRVAASCWCNKSEDQMDQIEALAYTNRQHKCTRQ